MNDRNGKERKSESMEDLGMSCSCNYLQPSSNLPALIAPTAPNKDRDNNRKRAMSERGHRKMIEVLGHCMVECVCCIQFCAAPMPS